MHITTIKIRVLYVERTCEIVQVIYFAIANANNKYGTAEIIAISQA